MAAPTSPTLYYLDALTPFNSVSELDDEHKITFQNDRSNMLEGHESFSDANTVEEPEISADGAQTINKQHVGALPQGIIVRGHVDLREDDLLLRIRSMSRKPQLAQGIFEFGRVGYYSGVSEIFDVHPSGTIGYTLKPPIVTHNSGTSALMFTFKLLLGGVRLT